VRASRDDNDQPSTAPAIPHFPQLPIASHQEISTSSYSS
jgi:hypothetical protein